MVLRLQIIKIEEISDRSHPLNGLILLLLLELRVLMKNFCEMRDHFLVGVKIIRLIHLCVRTRLNLAHISLL